MANQIGVVAMGYYDNGYEMNAQGQNGVVSNTVMGNIGWQFPVPRTPNDAANIVLLVSADGSIDAPAPPLPSDDINLVAVQAIGRGSGPGVIGQTGQGVGLPAGVGVAGFSLFVGDIDKTLGLATAQVAGVFGQCDGGPGVKGQGGAATNPPSPESLDFVSTPAGTGVIGIGGDSAAESTVTNPHQQPPSTTFPAQPAGPGVIGVAGDAPFPSADVNIGTGVTGVGAAPANGFPAGRGGVFVSAGNVAQVRLIPAPAGAHLPETGKFGDLYVTLTSITLQDGVRTRPSIFLCVTPDNPISEPPTVAQWAPFILGVAQDGGRRPIPPIPYEPI
jgi:hypothetical protein